MAKKKRRGSGSAVDRAPPSEPSDAPVSASSPEEARQPTDAGAAPGPLKVSEAPLAFDQLPADFLGAFFELCFPDRRLLQLCGELTLTAPGYRLESLPPDQVARLLADETLAAKDARALLDKAVREALGSPALESARLDIEQLAELLDLLVAGDPLQQLARLAWRALRDGGEGVELALACIEDGLALLEPAA